ncbi:MAG: Na/Pi cotransporter family protein [bacterium]
MSDDLQLGGMLVTLIGGLALFLYGLHKMTEALKIIAGERMKNLLALLTTNRVSAAFSGAIVTAVIQSSSVTTVLLVGFISAGIITFGQSIGVILGANVGTTITAQIIAFKITESALLLIGVGFFTELLAKRPQVKQTGVVFMGLGLLFFGMELMSQATSPLRDYEPFLATIRQLDNPIYGIVVGAAFTAIVQSSSATTGIVIIMASQGFLTLETGIAVILGANIGTCVTAIVSAIGKPRQAMQAATAHVIYNVLGVIFIVWFIPQFAETVRQISPVTPGLEGMALVAADTPRQIANAHTLFNVGAMLLFLPFTQTLAKIVLRIVPDRPEKIIPAAEPKYLDGYYLDQPALALDRVRMEIGRVGDRSLGMVRDSFPTLTVGTQERIKALHSRKKEVEALHKATVLYLRKLASRDLVGVQPQRLYQYMSIVNYLESLSDLVDVGIAGDSRKRLKKQLVFSAGTEEILREIYKEVFRAGDMCLAAIADNDLTKASTVIESKSHFIGLLEQARSHLYRRLTTESPEHLAVYKLESNTLEHYRRIHVMFRSICKLLLEEEVQEVEEDAIDVDSEPVADEQASA